MHLEIFLFFLLESLSWGLSQEWLFVHHDKHSRNIFPTIHVVKPRVLFKKGKIHFPLLISIERTIGLQIAHCLCFICISIGIETRCFAYEISASCCRKICRLIVQINRDKFQFKAISINDVNLQAPMAIYAKVGGVNEEVHCRDFITKRQRISKLLSEEKNRFIWHES